MNEPQWTLPDDHGHQSEVRARRSPPGDVVVVDVRMPFWSMVTFMVKWALASIPAALIFMTLAASVWLLFGATLLALVGPRP